MSTTAVWSQRVLLRPNFPLSMISHIQWTLACGILLSRTPSQMLILHPKILWRTSEYMQLTTVWSLSVQVSDQARLFDHRRRHDETPAVPRQDVKVETCRCLRLGTQLKNSMSRNNCWTTIHSALAGLLPPCLVDLIVRYQVYPVIHYLDGVDRELLVLDDCMSTTPPSRCTGTLVSRWDLVCATCTLAVGFRRARAHSAIKTRSTANARMFSI